MQPQPPQKKSKTGLIIVLILIGGLICLLAMITIGYFLIRNLTTRAQSSLPSLFESVATEAPALDGEATFDTKPLEATIEALLPEATLESLLPLATYIPELARVEPDRFAIAIATVDGAVYAVGDAEVRFTIQSVSKPLTYAAALEAAGETAVRRRIGVEPTGDAFNAITLSPNTGMPLNPMVNAGAIAATTRRTRRYTSRMRDSGGSCSSIRNRSVNRIR